MNISKMAVLLTANSEGLTKGLSKSAADVKKFAAKTNSFAATSSLSVGKLGSVFEGLGSVIGGVAFKAFSYAVQWMKRLGVAAIAAGSAIGYFTIHMVDSVGDSIDMAHRLGLTYNKLKAIQFAAKYAGLSVETIDGAFQKMSETLGAAKDGNKAAIDSFNRIGLSMEYLSRLRPENQFEAISAALNSINDPAQKLEAVKGIFGRAGGGLVVLFNNAGQAIKSAGEEIQTIGLALSNFNVEKIAAAGDALDYMRSVVEGIGTQLAVHVSPYLIALKDQTQSWIDSMGGIDNIVTDSLTALADKMQDVLNYTNWIKASWSELKDFAGAIKSAWNDLVPDWAKNALVAGKNALTINPVRDVIGNIISGIGGDIANKKAALDAQGPALGDRVAGWAKGARQRDINRRSDEALAKARQEKADFDAERAQRRAMRDAQRAQQIIGNAAARGLIPSMPLPRSGPLQQANHTPFAQQSMGQQSYDVQTNYLAQIAANTGRNNVAYAG